MNKKKGKAIFHTVNKMLYKQDKMWNKIHNFF